MAACHGQAGDDCYAKDTASSRVEPRFRAWPGPHVQGDKTLHAPAFQQQGVELLLRTLLESSEKVDILSFGSVWALRGLPRAVKSFCAGQAFQHGNNPA
jgi:hypothetical protein